MCFYFKGFSLVRVMIFLLILFSYFICFVKLSIYAVYDDHEYISLSFIMNLYALNLLNNIFHMMIFIIIINSNIFVFISELIMIITIYFVMICLQHFQCSSDYLLKYNAFYLKLNQMVNYNEIFTQYLQIAPLFYSIIYLNRVFSFSKQLLFILLFVFFYHYLHIFDHKIYSHYDFLLKALFFLYFIAFLYKAQQLMVFINQMVMILKSYDSSLYL